MTDRHVPLRTLIQPKLWGMLFRFGSLKLRTALVVPLLLQIVGTVSLVGWLSLKLRKRRPVRAHGGEHPTCANLIAGKMLTPREGSEKP